MAASTPCPTSRALASILIFKRDPAERYREVYYGEYGFFLRRRAPVHHGRHGCTGILAAAVQGVQNTGPGPPAPRIPIRFITFVLRIRRAPVWRGVRPVCTFTGLYSSIVPESFCRVNYSAVLHKVSTCFSSISSIPCNFSKPFAFISKSCYSILVGFVGFSFFPLDFDPALRYIMCPPTCPVCLFKF